MPEEILTYRWFARAYNWPPWWVDELTTAQEDWLPVVEEAWGEVERIKANEQRNSQGGG